MAWNVPIQAPLAPPAAAPASGGGPPGTRRWTRSRISRAALFETA